LLSTVTQWCNLRARLEAELNKPLHKKKSGKPSDLLAPNQSPIDTLSSKLGRRWPAISQAADFSHREKQKLRELLANENQSDTSIVVFGSLARNEFNSGSDLDWTLLVDGQADPDHLTLARKIRKILEQNKYKVPGPTGIFGNTAFSHPIVHEIGGADDTNKNTTQRILLLLESCAIGKPDAYDRVLDTILERYIVDDSGLRHSHPEGFRVPRFLLNDIVRYWRTVTVDFVYKQVERNEGWALRNAKLRMSRKLLIASGVLVCFGVNDAESATRDCMAGEGGNHSPLIRYLKAKYKMSPLEILAQVTLDKKVDPKVSLAIFDSYNKFLKLLGQDDIREHMKKLAPHKASKDSTYSKFRALGQEFHENIVSLLYHQDKGLQKLTEWYGVF
jgi:predicted nucleotidyltransferase